MLLFRSLFWLTLAFLVMRPGVDFSSAATAFGENAAETSRRMATDSIASIQCTDLTCVGGKAVLLAGLAGSETHAEPTISAPSSRLAVLPPLPTENENTAPLPRPRPNR